MRRHLVLVPAFATLFIAVPAGAQNQPPPIPPENAMKLSEIIAKIETRDQFRYISEIDWDEDGFYSIIYFTSDKAKVEINIDPATGQPK
jgi:hypothetical protein